MSTLVVGLSHRSAPLEVLDRAALTAAAVDGVLTEIAAGGTGFVREAVVLSTCNRIEIYADVSRFHGGFEEALDLLLRGGSLDSAQAAEFVYVHVDERAVHHAFSVAAGMDSLVVGEAQVLGQFRDALAKAQDASTVGPMLNELFQTALRVGKRAHAETAIDAAGRTLVTEALAAVEASGLSVAGSQALVVGAGSMAGLTASTLRAAGAQVHVVNRSDERAEHLARLHEGQAWAMADFESALAQSDLVISCTGAAGVLIDVALVSAVLAAKSEGATLSLVDLAMPHDIDPAVRQLPGVTLVTLADLVPATEGTVTTEAEAVRAIVAAEVAAFAAQTHETRVAPTVTALRGLADDLVRSELARFAARHPNVDPAMADEVAVTVRRVVSKLLHEPTVRVKQFAHQADGPDYERALRELFALDPAAVTAVTAPPDGPVNPS